MKRLLRQVKHSEVRASTECALTASAALPNSGFTFVDNSQGASAAVAELSKSLDTALDQIELEGDLNEQLKLPLQRLDNEASKYCNSQLSEDEKRTEWTCSLDKAQLIAIAWECAAGAYEPACKVVHESFHFRQEFAITPSIGGSRKVATMTVITESGDKQYKNPFLPLLVVGIRGSDSKVDHMVNANSQPRNASSFIDVHELCFEGSDVEAHTGFLNSAEVLEAAISKHMKELSLAEINHILFTGHSAGGAVASLLYLRYLSRRNIEYPLYRFSCVTFGSPPVINAPLPPRPQSSPAESVVLNIVNEFDVVTRADHEYVLSLVNLYRSIYQIPSVQEANTRGTGMTKNTEPTAAKDWHGDSTSNVWVTPSARYGHVGELLVLQMRVCDENETSTDNDDLADKLELRIFRVEAQAFQKLLFCRVSVHSRIEYRKRVDLIASGYFNSANGWESDQGSVHNE